MSRLAHLGQLGQTKLHLGIGAVALALFAIPAITGFDRAQAGVADCQPTPSFDATAFVLPPVDTVTDWRDAAATGVSELVSELMSMITANQAGYNEDVRAVDLSGAEAQSLSIVLASILGTPIIGWQNSAREGHVGGEKVAVLEAYINGMSEESGQGELDYGLHHGPGGSPATDAAERSIS